MDILLVSLVIFIIVGGILVFTLGGIGSGNKTTTKPALACPPGFSPSLAYKEKYGDNGIAYDEQQKAICILKPQDQPSPVFSYQEILAAAVFEDEILTAKSVRADDTGKQLLSQILTEDLKALFQDNEENGGEDQKPSSLGTSNAIELRILISHPEHPFHQIHFLNMEAKKGGVIHKEAIDHGKNWQDLLSYLIRLAGKPSPQAPQAPTTSGSEQTPQPEPATAAQS